MKILLLPIDNRPITYLFPQLICQLAGVSAFLPPREIMGGLITGGNFDELFRWLSTKLRQENPEALIVCLDSLLYGGLVSSRRTNDNKETILQRLRQIKSLSKLGSSKLKILAQSSIMRISDNYDNVEEKQYWSQYGREIFRWSQLLHQFTSDKTLSNSIAEVENKLPLEIRQDYLNTRMRNFRVNSALVEYVKAGIIDYLVFSQDDSGPLGLNLVEKQKLQDKATDLHVSNKINIYPGTDEVMATLIARLLIESNPIKPNVSIKFVPENGNQIASRYEGQTLGESLSAQMKNIGLSLSGEPSDFMVIVHTHGKIQGDHITLPGHENLSDIDTSESVNQTIALIEKSQCPVVLCDLAYANGSDPILCNKLLSSKEIMAKLWGYAGWNTSGNTIGSALAQGVGNWYARQTKSATPESMQQAFKEILFIRLADDFAYQSLVRKELAGKADADALARQMQIHLQKIAQAINFQPRVSTLNFPWQRTFEIEVACG